MKTKFMQFIASLWEGWGEMKQVVEPGEFKVMVGTASNDIRLDGEFTLTP